MSGLKKTKRPGCPKHTTPTLQEYWNFQGDHILDVGFDSGVSHAAVLEKRKDLSFALRYYLEGSDQHRGLSLSCWNPLNPRACAYKSVLTPGFVVDGDGKNVQSVGNVIGAKEALPNTALNSSPLGPGGRLLRTTFAFPRKFLNA